MNGQAQWESIEYRPVRAIDQYSSSGKRQLFYGSIVLRDALRANDLLCPSSQHSAHSSAMSRQRLPPA